MGLRSIGARWAGAGFLLLLLSVGIFAALQTESRRNSYRRSEVSRVESLTETVARGLRPALLKGEKEDAREVLEAAGGQRGIERVRLFNAEGVVVFSTKKDEIGSRFDKTSESCRVCHAEGKAFAEIPVGTGTRFMDAARDGDDYPTVESLAPIYNEPDCAKNGACHSEPQKQAVLGLVSLTISAAEAHARMETDRRAIWILASTGVFILCLFLGLGFYALVSVPIRKLARGARRAADGDLSHRIRIRTGGGLGDLAEALNQMTEKLEEAKRERAGWSKTLEEKVEERTRELKRMQEQLIQSEKLASLGKLAAGVAHEINNPLTGVLTSACLLREDTPEDSPFREDLEIIIEETKRCRTIIRGLLDFARQNKPAKKQEDVHVVLEKVLALVKFQTLFKRIRIVRDYAGELPRVEIDSDQFEQVFINIVLNAAEAMPKGGTLTIKTGLSGTGDGIEVCFADTGVGIPGEHLDRVFDPFFTTKKHGKGTGLGLGVSYGIVRRHGGTIEVRSEPGYGTAFTVIIPTGRVPDADELSGYWG